VIAEHDLYCCLLPQCAALHTCRSDFPIARQWPSQKGHAIDAVCCKKEGMLLQTLDTNMRTIKQNDWCTRRVIAVYVLYCCFQPQCEALRTCHSDFSIATICRQTSTNSAQPHGGGNARENC